MAHHLHALVPVAAAGGFGGHRRGRRARRGQPRARGVGHGEPAPSRQLVRGRAGHDGAGGLLVRARGAGALCGAGELCGLCDAGAGCQPCGRHVAGAPGALTAGSTGAFSNRWNRSRSRAVDWNARLRAEWHPDTLTSLSVEPSFSHRTSASGSLGRSAQFNADPYALSGAGNPLDAAFADPPEDGLAAILVNRQLRQRSGEGRTVSGGLDLVASRRLSRRGRSLDVSASASLNRTAGRAFNRSDIRYFQPGAAVPLRLTDQFADTPSERWAYRVQAGWNEPLFEGASLQLRYSYARGHNRNDRSIYRLDSLDGWSVAHTLGELPDGEVLQSLLDARTVVTPQPSTPRTPPASASAGSAGRCASTSAWMSGRARRTWTTAAAGSTPSSPAAGPTPCRRPASATASRATNSSNCATAPRSRRPA